MTTRRESDLRSATGRRELSAALAELAGPAGWLRSPPPLAPAARARARRSIEQRGFEVLGAVIDPASAESLVALLDRVIDLGLPPVFVFATEVALELGERIAEDVSDTLGAPYVLIEDVWAWRIPPGASGWSAHRGTDALLDRSKPELVNAWIALSDVERDRSAMHFVPLASDPHYPANLARIDHEGSDAVSEPLTAGQALLWNANVLHWGGACAEDARGARVSCSFSLVRADTAAADVLRPRSLSAADRLDLVALQIATYGDRAPEVGADVLEWARATRALHALTSGLRR